MIVTKQILQPMFVILLSLICTLSVNARVEIGGLCYNLDDTNLTAEVSQESSDIIENTPGTTMIIIPATIRYNGNTYAVTKIGYAAFYQCGNITNVTIPKSVTKIGACAFFRCYSLQNIIIPNSVTEIDVNAFKECKGLTSITIPNSVTKIGSTAFSDCSNLTSINIPNSITELDEAQFADCKSLTSVTIPSSVTKLFAFGGCNKLTSITIPESVIELGGFYGCNGLTSITIPKSVKKICWYAFSECKGLTSITLPDSVTEIDTRAFSGCPNLTSLTILNPNIKIADDAFYDCKNLTSVNIPKNSTIDVSKCFLGIAFNREQVIQKIRSGGRITRKDCNGNHELLMYYAIGTWKRKYNDYTAIFTVKADGSFTGTVTLNENYARYSQYTGRVTKFSNKVSGTISGVCSFVDSGEICFEIKSRKINSAYSSINGIRVSAEESIRDWNYYTLGCYFPNYTTGHNQILDNTYNYCYRISANRGGTRSKKK